MTFKFDPASARARFHELRAQRDSIRERSEPLRAERDRLEADYRDRIELIDAEIRTIEQELPPVKDEMAFLCRALNGKTGAVQ